MSYLSEADLEAALLEQLQALGYTRTTDARIGPDGRAIASSSANIRAH